MASYIRFATANGDTVLVEVVGTEINLLSDGVDNASRRKRAHGAVVDAQDTLEAALQRVLHSNARANVEAVGGLPERPDEVELTFGLNATGEAGNFAVAKADGEANYTLRLTWKRGER